MLKFTTGGVPMGLLEKRTGDRGHSRTLEIATYPMAEQGLIVTGELIEKRLRPCYDIYGELRPPHTVHHMIIRMSIEGPGLTIREIEAEMPGVPREACRETAPFLNRLAGMNITSGFTLKAREIVGGRNGCAHLLALLTAMAPAAVQGFWVHHAARPVAVEKSAGLMERYLLDTCWVWRREGPLAAELLRNAAAGSSADRRSGAPAVTGE